MKKKFLIGVVVVLSLIISACQLPASASPTAITNQAVAVIEAEASEVATEAPVVTEVPIMYLTSTSAALLPTIVPSNTPLPTVVATAQPQGYDYAGLPKCNPDESTPISGAKQNKEGLWEIDIRTVSGCNLVFEGRIVPGERLHRVIVLRSANGENTEFVKDGVFIYAEGSIWEKQREKNMEDVANVNDPAEALKLLNDKRGVMDNSGYNWSIYLYFTDGTVTEFGPGETWEGLTPQNHCDFSEPVMINVHGEKLEGKNQFSAAIGSTDCITVAWIDNADEPTQWTGQRDAGNKVVYTTIEAWLMPSSWSQDQIDTWIADQK